MGAVRLLQPSSAGRRSQPATLSSALIDSVADTTLHRDRDELDRAIVSLLSRFLEADAAILYRLEMNAGNQYLRRGVTAVRGHEVDGSSQPCEPRALNEVPAWHKCVTERRAVPYSLGGGTCRTVFPIASEREVIGILELETRARLSTRDSDLVCGILRIVKNHLALLDYSESDTLTGLLNRKTFETRFGKLRTGSGAIVKEEPSWLGIVDIDKFKSINDTYGHLFGDEVLLLVAGLLKQAFRGTDQLFRFGGEEFIIVLDRATAPGAQVAFERLRRMIEEFRFPQIGQVTISLGYTRVSPKDAAGTSIERADAALYYAKHHGRNNVRSYEALVEAGELKTGYNAADIELF